MSKIIILTQYYPPEHGAPQNRLHDLARRMKEAGHQITVLTALPNYPKGEVFPAYRGKFYLKEELDGIEVMRCWILPSKKKSTVRQLICYFSFVLSSALVGLFKLKPAGLLVCESPPLFLGATALFLSFAKSAKLIMNISDLWPESAIQLGMLKPGFALSFLEYFEKLLYKKSALVLCQTEGIVKGVKKRFAKARIFLLPNGVDIETFKRHPRDANFAKQHGLPEGAFIVGYAGNHGRSQALSQILDAAKIIHIDSSSAMEGRPCDDHNERGHGKSRDPDPDRASGRVPPVLFALFGDGAEKDELMKKSKEMGLKNVRFFDSVPRERMPDLLSNFDLALVPLKNINIFDGARPSKIFELMGMQLPFIFCGKGEGAEIAEKSGGATVVPPEAPEKLADAILEFAKLPQDKRTEMGKKARKFVEMNFDRAKIADDFMKKIAGI